MIENRLKKVILTELNLEDFLFDESTVANMVPGWDSLSHARIIMAVEEEFGIHFKTLEIIRMKNVGDLQNMINKKLE